MLIQLLIIQIITFVGLVFVLRFIFSRNLNTALGRLNVLNEENLVKEAQLTDELKRAQKEREAEVGKGKSEAAELVEEAKKEAAKTRMKLEEEARQQAEAILRQAGLEAKDLKESVNKEIQGRSLELAIKIIEQAFAEKNKEELQHEFIDETIAEIARVAKERFTVSADTVKVTSAFPLLPKQKDALQKTLEDKLGASLKIEEVINRELISGFTVDIGGLVIDGSLRNKLNRIIPELEKT